MLRIGGAGKWGFFESAHDWTPSEISPTYCEWVDEALGGSNKMSNSFKDHSWMVCLV